MSLNKFILKIYYITNLIILILYHEISTFLYNFNQSLDRLTSKKMRIPTFYGRGSITYVKYVQKVTNT